MGFFDIASLLGGLGGGIASIFSGGAKANAANSAAQTQANSAQQGINLLNPLLGQQQANSNPYIQGGQTSLAQIMQGFSNGTFGTPQAAPQYTGGSFQAPTAAQAAATPGYQFAAQQGSKGVLQGAAAAGGAISGGTLKALDSFNSGLASNTYQNTFNNALSTYGAGLQQYQAQLQGYGAGLQGNQQAFNQLFAPVSTGAGAAANLNNSQTALGSDIASEYNNQGNALAAGIVGSTNAQTGGIQSGINQILGPNGGNISTLGGLVNGMGGGGSTGGNLAAGGGGGNILPPVGTISPFSAGGPG